MCNCRIDSYIALDPMWTLWVDFRAGLNVGAQTLILLSYTVQLLMQPVNRVLGMSVLLLWWISVSRHLKIGCLMLLHSKNICQLGSCQLQAFTQDNGLARMGFRTFYPALATIYLPMMILTLPSFPLTRQCLQY